jgi:hypothetical protein
MNRVALPPEEDPEAMQVQLDLRRRQRLALVVTSTSAVLAGLAIGYALGIQHSFQRALAPGDDHGV